MNELNPQQLIAANHVEGPLLVLAGAGSGKTRVVTHRIAHLIDLGIVPSDILAVTFTNKAAEEMRSRIRSMKNAQVLACTFHSLGARILRESIGALGYKYDFTIYDEEDSEKLLRTVLEQLGMSGDKGLLKESRAAISSAKNNLLSPDKIQEEPLQKIYELYQKKLKDCNALDFDDLLYLTVKLLQENERARTEYQERWLFVLIDEYQDTNSAQYTLARLLVAKHGNIFAVGDPDQSIYSWRGAQYQNILRFESDFPGAKVVLLEQNYRSTNNILQASNALIEHNTSRYDKKLWSAHGDGEKISLFVASSDRGEAEFVAGRIGKHAADFSLDEMAIFYRTNAQSRAFEDALLKMRIGYKIIGGLSFYARREIKDILAFLRMVVSSSDLISFLRTINLPKRGFGATTLEKLVAAAEEARSSILPFCQDALASSSLFKLSGKQQAGLSGYIKLIYTLREKKNFLKIHELIAEVISESGYLNHLQEDPETFQDRKENLDELMGKAAEWEQEHEKPSLQQFLEELSLRSSTDETAHLPSVKLMTLHNSKGLEFPVVFLVGLEEDLCPHINSKDNAEALEEERRLCYVGMTRAKEILYLTAASYRFFWGTSRPMRPSRFLKEIPAEFLRNLSPAPFQSSEAESGEVFSPGERVYHQQFGVGVIERSFQTSLGLTYDIHFLEADLVRSIVARFAKLQPYNEND
jgi:DNA helicase-2/ATP-dependent DNA helicase PcrA